MTSVADGSSFGGSSNYKSAPTSRQHSRESVQQVDNNSNRESIADDVIDGPASGANTPAQVKKLQRGQLFNYCDCYCQLLYCIDGAFCR